VKQTGEFLRQYQLGGWVSSFAARGVDGAMLARDDLSERDLEELGIDIRLCRMRLLEGIRNAKLNGGVDLEANITLGAIPNDKKPARMQSPRVRPNSTRPPTGTPQPNNLGAPPMSPVRLLTADVPTANLPQSHDSEQG
jgi:hypothetical protein